MQNVESEEERIARAFGEPFESPHDPNLKALFKDKAGAIAKMKEELSAIVQNIEAEKLPTRESILNLFEKMIVGFRRLTYYGNKLREAQGEE